MIIEIDDESKDPPYIQLRAAIAHAIGTGELAQGAKLPSIRQIAGDLGLANNTVARAYRELEADGFVVSRGRRGTVVMRTPEPDADAKTKALVDDFVANGRQLGLDAGAMMRLLAEALAR